MRTQNQDLLESLKNDFAMGENDFNRLQDPPMRTQNQALLESLKNDFAMLENDFNRFQDPLSIP
jgi:hypothetical protein